LNKQTKKFLTDDWFIENNILKPTPKGKFLTDGIASDLFLLKFGRVNLTTKETKRHKFIKLFCACALL
jgi:hypothetical protein